ncbi:hypothetical protein TorRG33x02_285100 [Trema orientale]|uniref:Uncharacterized protein n=1 Tax=Trema orientale TaxID=63057 RepID=A0A2P5CGY8_TREOI|nr:hypothetical protein TorRG33x02_285100 [Trema orientale]
MQVKTIYFGYCHDNIDYCHNDVVDLKKASMNLPRTSFQNSRNLSSSSLSFHPYLHFHTLSLSRCLYLSIFLSH